MNPSSATIISNGYSAGTSAGNNIEAPRRLSRYESRKRRDWNTFGHYLENQEPPIYIPLSQCDTKHIIEILRYLDQSGKTKVHYKPCPCPLRQAWGSLDALIGRLRAAYEEHDGSAEQNPFGNGYLREVNECQAQARGIVFKKKSRKRANHGHPIMMNLKRAA